MTFSSTIPAAVGASIAARGAAPAVVESGALPERRVTYSELGARVLASTRAMIAAGVRPGDRVAIWAPNGLEWIVAALGAQCSGAALVPVNTRWKGAEAAFVLAASRAKILCTAVGFLGTDTVAMLAADDTELPELERIVVFPGAERTATGSTSPAVPVEPWDALLEAGGSVPDADAIARRDGVGPDDISDILFTSGTTGRPKGVLMNHGQTVQQFTDWADFVGLTADDRYLVVNPFFHMFGYKAGWLASLMRGATIHPVPALDVGTVLSIVERERITVLPGAPAIYRTILDHPDLERYDIRSLRVAVTGAADIPVSLIEEMRARLPFSVVLTGYGLTEAGTCTISRPGDDAETVATTAGQAAAGFELRVVDGGGGDARAGEPGELVVRGFGVMQGYLDDPAATAAAIDGDGFLHTGDLATIDDRGYVRIVGRLKDMIIVGGFNVYPAEVENVLLGHDDIGEAAVIGIPDARLGEVPMAWVVPAPGRDPDPGDIIDWSGQRMANYKVPRRVAVIDALPLNAAGKVVKTELRERAAGAAAAPSREGPRR
jgi:acyl-CoA synthetase (AMP-forming)/AMP-acid ligase II